MSIEPVFAPEPFRVSQNDFLEAFFKWKGRNYGKPRFGCHTFEYEIKLWRYLTQDFDNQQTDHIAECAQNKIKV